MNATRPKAIERGGRRRVDPSRSCLPERDQILRDLAEARERARNEGVASGPSRRTAQSAAAAATLLGLVLVSALAPLGTLLRTTPAPNAGAPPLAGAPILESPGRLDEPSSLSFGVAAMPFSALMLTGFAPAPSNIGPPPPLEIVGVGRREASIPPHAGGIDVGEEISFLLRDHGLHPDQSALVPHRNPDGSVTLRPDAATLAPILAELRPQFRTLIAQKLLRDERTPLAADGIPGPKTREAVRTARAQLLNDSTGSSEVDAALFRALLEHRAGVQIRLYLGE